MDESFSYYHFLIVAFVIRANRTGNILPRTGLEIPWVLFLGSAIFATLIAIYPNRAMLQFNRLVAAFVLLLKLLVIRISCLNPWAARML